MELKEKAKLFVMNAYMEQRKLGELDKPAVIHPINVGMLLGEYGYDDNLIVAGYLHDIIQNTNCRMEDLKKEFGLDIANLVISATEPNKTLFWEERIKYTFEKIKKLPLRNKLIICADKIDNLEDLLIEFQKNGKRDFSIFKIDEKKQKWYHLKIYESLVFGEDENLPIFRRYKDIIDNMFFYKEDIYFKNVIFKDNEEYYDKLKKIHAQKVELQRLKTICSLSKPFVVEVISTPQSGKVIAMNNLYHFFTKGGFKVFVIEEFSSSKYYQKVIKDKINQSSLEEKNKVIGEFILNQLQYALTLNKEIILVNQCFNDRQIWSYLDYQKGYYSKEVYLELKNKYMALSKQLIDLLIIIYTEPLSVLKNHYLSSIGLEKRHLLTMNNLKNYNNAISELNTLFNLSTNSILLDSTSKSIPNVSVEMAQAIMPVMKEKYLKYYKDRLY